MSKKKSYMNYDNILSEGFFDKVGKFFKLLKQAKKERKLLKDPKIKSKVNKLNKDIDDLQGNIRKLAKKYGIEDKLEF
tara:strand:+ start:20 stop:253 length:234 start_codon:yes stop_codon:yes gene_type:complete